MPRFLKAGIGAVLALVLAFGVSACGDGGSAVFASVVEPVEVSVVAPQYVADLPRDGVLARRGDQQRTVFDGSGGVWLIDGRVVINREVSQRCPGRQDDSEDCGRLSGLVLDLDGGSAGTVPGLERGAKLTTQPGGQTTAGRVNLRVSEPTFDAPVEITYSYAPDLSTPIRIEDPVFAEDEQYYVKSFGRVVHSIGDWDYLRFSVGDEESTAHNGYVMRRRGTDEWTKVLVDQGILDLWVARDGSALLGLQRVDPDEDCSECDRAERIVEIDPRNGEIAATYGSPAGYDKKWKVVEVDKMDDRLLVRYRRGETNKGVWQYDGRWSLVDGTDDALTWWQGKDDRIEVVPSDSEVIDAPPFALDWVHGDRRTRLPGEMPSDFLYDWNFHTIPGTLAPPA